MTRANQTVAERRHVESFFRRLFSGEDSGLVFESPGPPAPDVLVRGTRLAEVAGEGVDGVALEVTEYHPAAWGQEPVRRTEVDTRWQEKLLPAITEARSANPALKNVAAWFDFKDVRLPKKRDHLAVAEDLVRTVQAALPRIPPGQRVRVYFFDKATLSTIPNDVPGWTFLATEDYPDAAEHFNVICLESDPEWDWPLWTCPRMLGGWNAPSDAEFGRILVSKAEKAKKYDTKRLPLWLLIVAELKNDQESHIFPRGSAYLPSLHEQVSATGFDFAAGPFQQVWLFSEFTEDKVRLFPAS
jgi:hypothetical protein